MISLIMYFLLLFVLYLPYIRLNIFPDLFVTTDYLLYKIIKVNIVLLIIN